MYIYIYNILPFACEVFSYSLITLQEDYLTTEKSFSIKIKVIARLTKIYL